MEDIQKFLNNSHEHLILVLHNWAVNHLCNTECLPICSELKSLVELEFKNRIKDVDDSILLFENKRFIEEFCNSVPLNNFLSIDFFKHHFSCSLERANTIIKYFIDNNIIEQLVYLQCTQCNQTCADDEKLKQCFFCECEINKQKSRKICFRRKG
jgi:hypothetical protein